MATPSKFLHLEVHATNFIAETYLLSCAQTGRLMRMLMAEALREPVVPPADPELAKVWNLRETYRKIRRRAARPSVRREMREAIFERDCRMCAYCDAALTWKIYHCDHVVPVSRGGANEPGNLAASCKPCNLSKGTKLLSEWVH